MKTLWTLPRAIPWIGITVVPSMILADTLRAAVYGFGGGLGLVAAYALVG